jgi:predicted Rossmann fold nucleotide-binding protein DprA/Smf involved in DNA uptake
VTIETKHCPTCDADLPLSAFGDCKSRKNGKNIYCKLCNRLRTAFARHKQRARRPQQMPRERPARRDQTPGSKILEALERGPLTWTELKEETGLSEDTLSEALFELTDEGKVLNRNRVYSLVRKRNVA